ncbi:MAG: hypothetical protein AB8B50_06520 [Pirellulaceae bacterium]
MPTPFPFQDSFEFEDRSRDSNGVEAALDNRRNSGRVEWQQVTVIQALDCDGNPVGEPITAVSNDLSAKGIGFVSPARPETERLRLTFLDEDFVAHARLIHCTDIGDDFPQFLLGTNLEDRNSLCS